MDNKKGEDTPVINIISVDDNEITKILKTQKNKCANNPKSVLRKKILCECPLWKKSEDKGIVTENIHPIILDKNDEKSKVQIICNYCYTYLLHDANIKCILDTANNTTTETLFDFFCGSRTSNIEYDRDLSMLLIEDAQKLSNNVVISETNPSELLKTNTNYIINSETTNINMYNTDDKTADIIKKLYNGCIVTLINITDEWAYISYANVHGYIKSKFNGINILKEINICDDKYLSSCIPLYDAINKWFVENTTEKMKLKKIDDNTIILEIIYCNIRGVLEIFYPIGYPCSRFGCFIYDTNSNNDSGDTFNLYFITQINLQFSSKECYIEEILDSLKQYVCDDNSKKNDNNNSDQQLECQICMENIGYRIALVPCGHSRFCETCIGRLKNKRCPFCTTTFTTWIRIWD